MTILSNHTITERLDELVSNPERIDVDTQVQPASLDLRLGAELYDQGVDKVIYPERGEHELRADTPYLGHTEETVTLPPDVAALMTGRSSIARRHVVVHQTAGWVDPGFRGELTFELANFGDETARLGVGDRVAQLVFFTLDRAADPYDGQFQGQTGVTRTNGGNDGDE